MSGSKVYYRSLSFIGFSDYRVGIDGSIWSRNGRWDKRWKKLKPWGAGHLMVSLCGLGKTRIYLVHRLVLEAFVGPCPDGMEACHFPDRNPKNNHLDNLRWDTTSNNQKDRVFHGTDNFKPGELHPNAKLTESRVKQILSLRRDKSLTIEHLAQLFDMSFEAIRKVVRRETWKHVVLVDEGI